MMAEDSLTVGRPDRWREPLDASMTDADVAWLRSREPFASMNPKSFSRPVSLEGILRNDCRIYRCEPGEVIAREGDYGSSAYLVLAGSVRVLVHSLRPERIGRSPTRKQTWSEALTRFLFRSRIAESRRPEDVTPNVESEHGLRVRRVDDRPAVFLQDFDAVFREKETVILGPADLFGEVAAMYRSPRSATVIAETEATLLEIRWQGLRLLRRDAGFEQNLEAHYRKHWLTAHLREIPLLRHLPEASLARVAAVTQLRSFGRTEWYADYAKVRHAPIERQIESEPVVAQEGRVPTDLIVVRNGFGRLSQQYGASHRTTAYLGKGHLHGLEELAYNALRPVDLPVRALQQSLRAVGFLDALLIPAEAFAEEILPHVGRHRLPKLAADLLIQSPTNRAPEHRDLEHRDFETRDFGGEDPSDGRPDHAVPADDSSETLPQKQRRTERLEFILQHRFNNGRQAMVIDVERCTRCDDCVRACASAHDGNPRFDRSGLTHGRLQFVQACMHCSDPVCMIGCPTGAIARDQVDGVVEIHEAICVGCGMCATNCPYDNIRMVEIFDAEGRVYLDSQSQQPILKATKCDMCQGQPAGPLCVQACPHDALVRIDLTEPHPLEQWINRRS